MTITTRAAGLALAVLATLLGPRPAVAGGLTARASLAEVQAKAKAWHGDATLVHLSSTTVRADGTASEWKYAFHAPGSGTRCVVTARAGAVTIREVRLGNYTEPLGPFVDSDQAMAVARSNGLKGSQPSMSVIRPAGTAAGGTRWLVAGGLKDGDTSITIDAASGAFVKRSVMGKD